MRWFMAGPAARDQRNLGLVPIRAAHHLDMRISVQPRQGTARGFDNPVHGICNKALFGIDKLAHVSLLSANAGALRIKAKRIFGCDFQW